MLSWFKCFALCFLTLFMGCSDPSSSKTRLLLDWWPNPDHVPIYVGVKKGFFQEEGFDLEILKTGEPPQALLFLLSGRAEIALHSAPNTLSALGKCPDLRFCGTLIDRPLRAFLFLSDSEIYDPHDLHDRVLGGNPEGLLFAYVHSAMKNLGIQFREVRKMSWDAPTALLTRAVDVIAGCFWNIEPVQLRASGVDTRYFTIETFGVPTYDELIFLTLRQHLEEDPSFSERFQRALQRSIDWCRAHPEEAFGVYLSAQTERSSRAVEWEREAWKLTLPLFAHAQEINEGKWEHLLQWMEAQGLVKHPTVLKPFLELAFEVSEGEGGLECALRMPGESLVEID